MKVVKYIIAALALSFTASSAFAAATKPGAPTNVVATAGIYTAGDTSSVSFTPPANNGGATITSYTVSCNPACTPVSGVASPIKVTGLASATPYTYTVTATNSVGTGPASAASNAAPTCYSAAEPMNSVYYVGYLTHFSYKNRTGSTGDAYCTVANGCDGYVVALLTSCSNFTGPYTNVMSKYGSAYDSTLVSTLYSLKNAGREVSVVS